MKFLQFLKQESSRPLNKIVLVAGLSGISNAVLLAIVNSATSEASYDKLNFRFMALFLITFTIYVI
ncbi:MAG: hypothetical protein GY940_34510, partial [bacterium]|nr:hypothetical protein [bacterium]